MKEKISLNLLLLLLLYALLVGVLRCSAQEAPNWVQIPTEQFMTLRENNSRLQLKLIELEANLETLANQSNQLTEQLSEARLQLEQSQQALKEAKNSLTNVEELQKRTSESLQSLEYSLKLEREQQKDQVNKLKWQRNMYAVLACILATR